MKELIFDVKGIMYRPKWIIKKVAEDVSSGDFLTLKRERDNEYDEFAVRVYHDEDWIGYVEQLYSEDVSEILDSDDSYTCKVWLVDADYDFDFTDSGREIEVIKNVFLTATLTIDSFEDLNLQKDLYKL